MFTMDSAGGAEAPKAPPINPPLENVVGVGLFVSFDSLRPFNDLSVMKGQVFLG